MMKSLGKNRCFTLIEMIVVVAIIALLAGFVGPKVMDYLDRAKVTSSRAQAGLLADANKAYKIDVGQYLAAGVGFEEFLRNESGNKKWDGPYLDGKYIPKDAWENEFVYVVPGADGMAFDIISYGSDGQPGGEGYAADITNWDEKK